MGIHSYTNHHSGSITFWQFFLSQFNQVIQLIHLFLTVSLRVLTYRVGRMAWMIVTVPGLKKKKCRVVLYLVSIPWMQIMWQLSLHVVGVVVEILLCMIWMRMIKWMSRWGLPKGEWNMIMSFKKFISHTVELLLMLEQNKYFYNQYTDQIYLRPRLIYHQPHHQTHHLYHQRLSALI